MTAIQNVNSPAMKMTMNLLQGKGMSAEQMVRGICQQRGLDVDAFMSEVEKAKR